MAYESEPTTPEHTTTSGALELIGQRRQDAQDRAATFNESLTVLREVCSELAGANLVISGVPYGTDQGPIYRGVEHYRVTEQPVVVVSANVVSDTRDKDENPVVQLCVDSGYHAGYSYLCFELHKLELCVAAESLDGQASPATS